MKRMAIMITLMMAASAQAGDLLDAMKAAAPAPDPVLGPSWTYPGDIYNHLRGPNHAHEIPGVDLSKLTRQQAEDLHSDLHNAERMRSVSYTYSAIPAAGGCPNGVCPANLVRRTTSVRVARTVTVSRFRERDRRRPLRRLLGRLFRGRR